MNSLSLTSEVNGDVLGNLKAGAMVYLIGAGGCGVSGLGHLLLDAGMVVTGSDATENLEVRQLIARGAAIHLGHCAENIHRCQPQVVIFSTAIRRDNPELAAARALGIPVLQRGAALAALVRGRRGVCIGGMHGKTTTSAMLAYALEQLGERPSFAVGAQVPQLPRHARWTAAGFGDACRPWFVVETDESDGTCQYFEPEHCILLNLDEEHLDYFSDLESICREFATFAQRTRGQVVFCVDDPELRRMLTGQARAVSYGFHAEADYRIGLTRAVGAGQQGTLFELWQGKTCLGEFETRLLGEKNVSNAAAVLALLHELGFGVEAMAGAIREFKGAARRQQELYRDDRYWVFDDYGHHPNEIRATIKALRTLGTRRLLVAFQPHRFTRTQHLRQEFATCFEGVDRLWLTEIYAASELPIPWVTGESLAESIRGHGVAVEYISDVSELTVSVRSAMELGDLVLFLGAGDITREANRLAASLKAPAPGAGFVRKGRESFANELRQGLSSSAVVRVNESLARRTTLRVGGVADVYVEPANETDLAWVLRLCSERQQPFVLLGRGSNLLIRDGGIRGVVICLSHPHFSNIVVTETRLACGAGAKLKAIAQEARRQGLAGLEFLDGIPGSLGGGLRMNAGAMGSSVFQVVESLRFMDPSGEIQEVPVGEVRAEYRNCPLFKTRVALGATLKGEPADPAWILERMNACNEKRWSSQPAAPSAGCIFKNPGTIPAGKLVEELGLKGTRIGGAAVSDVHGNFIVNMGQATARDVLTLISLIKRRSKEERGIELETEVEILGEDVAGLEVGSVPSVVGVTEDSVLLATTR